MALRNWWEVATPHKDIREGKLSEAVFAADIGDVISNRAPLDYHDPVMFFQHTFFTKGITNLIKNVIARLNGENGDPVIQLQTPFGGGKTHSLLALYHIIKNYQQLCHIDFVKKLKVPKESMVVVFTGTHHDPIKGRTPWGEIAYQLGKYDKVKENDERRRAPGKQLLDEILGKKPVLILIDELVEYLVKARDFGDQVCAFSQELTETVKTKDNCCVVCTLPSSAPYGEPGAQALNELQRIFGRLEAIYSPVEGIEIYEIVRKRLFEDPGDEKIIKKVAQDYFNMYQRLGNEIPSEAREIGYRQNIESAYPFHPELIDVLYERWGSFPTFQRTRGVLRLLALVISDLYKRKVPSPLIHSSLVNLNNPVIRQELVKHIGNEFDSVIKADICQNAMKIDQDMGSEYQKYNIATIIATGIFLHSFTAGERRKTTLPIIRLAVLRPGILSPIVGDAIKKLEDDLWYLHSENNTYSFETEPNLNRVIINKEETITNERIDSEFKEILKQIAGSALDVYIWPESHKDIPDDKSIKLAILSPDYPAGSEDTTRFAQELLEKAGTGFRVYKNTLFVLAIDRTQIVPIKNNIRRLIALRELKKEENLFSGRSREDLNQRLRETERNLAVKIITYYRNPFLWDKKGNLYEGDMGMPQAGFTEKLSEHFIKWLEKQEYLLSQLTPKYLREKTFGTEEKEKRICDIYEFFLKTPGMPLPKNPDVVIEAINSGVNSGLFMIKEQPGMDLDMDTIIILPEPISISRPVPTSPQTEPCGTSEGPVTKKEPIGKKEKKLLLKAEIDYEKISEFQKGVIIPLVQKGCKPIVRIEIVAETAGGLDENTLNMKIKETLNQIGRIIDWQLQE